MLSIPALPPLLFLSLNLMKFIYSLSKNRWASRIVLAVVLVLWMFLLHFLSHATWMAALQNWTSSFSDNYHDLKVDNPRPINEVEKVFLFLELIYLYFVAWFVCKRLVFRGQLDNTREHIRYWAGLLLLLMVMGWGFRKTFWGMWLGSILIAMSSLYIVAWFTKPYSYIIDGTVIRDSEEVRRYYQRLKPRTDPGVTWAGMQLPTKEAMTNFLIVGAVGSGKTISLTLLMRSVIPQIGSGQNQTEQYTRAIVYDYKGEMPSLIAGINPSAEIHILNPLHEHCTAWDMAADITTDMNAEMFATVLFFDPPGGQTKDAFFIEAARKCLKGVTLFLNDTAPKVWSLRDIVYIMLSQQRLTAVLSYSERTSHNLDYFAADRMAAAVMATIKSKIEVYIPIAALWHRAQKKISLKHWANSSSILVLGHDPENAVNLRALNSLIFDRAAQILLKKENVKQPHTYLFCDELGTLSKLSMLEEVAKTGRSKGVVLAVGFQSIDDIYGLYGKEQANVIISQFLNKAILRLSDESTGKWAENLIGQMEILRITKSRQHPDWASYVTGFDWSAKHSDNETYVTKSAVKASEFREILPIGESDDGEQGLTGWYIGHYVYKHYYPFKKLIAQLPTPSPYIKDRCDAPDHWQRFESWTMEDLRRLNLIQHQELLPQENSSQGTLPPSSTQQLPEDQQPPADWKDEADSTIERFHELLGEEDEDLPDSEAA